ncbi:hypothetical protein C2E23DRAFT_849159 [Lenzites betulinus]|nr:hypothetical protein C2E23DRAFT_849159 [Lenzites betulinus]
MAGISTMMEDLDDPAKTCVYIPPGKQSATAPSDDYELRMQAYRTAWSKCLNRVQSILRALQGPSVDKVTAKVINAYNDVLPGLPYPELPVIALHGTNASLVENISHAFHRRETASLDEPGDLDDAQVLQTHLHPAECSSVANMMKGIITGFVESGSKRRPMTALANFDINLLRAWHSSQAPKAQLVIFLHEFEKFDSSVVQDMFYICSMHIPHLPLVFVILMASPPVPSYLHSAYPRSTLALLRVQPIVVSSGPTMVKDVLTKTFFDLEFEPDVMLGPSALEFITEFSTRHITSPDVVTTLLQIAYMKHFTQPLSIFTIGESLGEPSQRKNELKLGSDPGLRALVEGLQLRLFATTPPSSQPRAGSSTPVSPKKANGAVHGDQWRADTAGDLMDCVSRARVAFRKNARRMRAAFAIAGIAERVALGAPQTHTGRSTEDANVRFDSPGMLSVIMRGRAGSHIRYVCMAVRKLPSYKLRELLHELHAFLRDLQSADIKRDEENARVWIVTTINRLPPQTDDPGLPEDGMPAVQGPAVKELAAVVGDWLQAYITERLVRLDEQVLWDIWYTGNTPFPSELVNPAPRPTIISALLHPHDFARAHADMARVSAGGEPTAETDVGDPREPALWELPDTSIAFRRYVEAGRMVNVYDWFESFAVVLEDQRRKLRRRARLLAEGRTDDGKGKARYGGRRGRSRSADVDMDVDPDMADDGAGEESDEEELDELDEEEEEKWKIEVQARFMRALHELDYMGFVKHTGRKPDHVIRTIYDVPD